jgi:putative transposase
VVDEALAREIKAVIDDPRYVGYGCRRVWAVLRFDRNLKVGKKKVRRVMRIKGWQAKPIRRPRRCGGTPYDRRRVVVDPQAKVRVSLPDVRWSTDLTKVYTEEDGWGNVIPVMDCGTVECVGYRISGRGRSLEAREALEAAVVQRFGDVRSVPSGLALRTDNGGIFLSKEYWEETQRLGVAVEYTPCRCPQANGVVERFIRTLKEECVWQHRFRTLQEAEEVISRWIEFYNRERRHSSLGYMTPLEYRQSLRKFVA